MSRVFKNKTASSSYSGDREPITFRSWSKWEKGDVLIGKFKGSFDMKNKFSKDPKAMSRIFKVEVLEANFMVVVDGKKVSPVGLTLGLNEGGRFTKWMNSNIEEGNIKPGIGLEIHYDGKAKGFEEGDNTLYHQFPVLEAGELEESEEANAEAGL